MIRRQDVVAVKQYPLEQPSRSKWRNRLDEPVFFIYHPCQMP
jgi:hypothetical protein